MTAATRPSASRTPTGTDALQLGFMEPILAPNSAFRITTVPTGLVSGVVTDANDGEPIAGATVTAHARAAATATTEETARTRSGCCPATTP